MDLATRFYLTGQTQVDIARSLGLDPSTVSRYLKRARDEGIVRVQIQRPRSLHGDLAQELAEHFHLKRAVVVAGEPGAGATEAVARAAADYVNSQLLNGMRLGLSWGRMLSAAIHMLPPGTVSDLDVSLLHGGVGSAGAGIQGHELARHLASIHPRSHVHYLHAPVLVDSPDIKDAMLRDGSIRGALESAADLASLQMSAREDGDHFICNGHKIWTTHAHVANWIFCLVRTSREKIPQLGITFLVIDMRTPGVEVKPIVSLSGEHIQNEVFFSDVRVPRNNVVGQVGEGWTVAKYLMQFERGGGVSSPGLKSRMERIRLIVLAGKIADNSFAAKLAQAQIEVDSLEALELHVMSKLSRGQPPGAESSMLKMVATELSQRLTELALEAVGLYALPYQPFAVAAGGPSPNYRPTSNQSPVGPEYSWTIAAKYLNDRAGSIYAGTSEVQRNILAKAVLGL